MPSYEYSLITICRAGADTVEQISLLHSVEPLTIERIQRVDASIEALQKVCGQENIPEAQKLLTIAKAALMELLIVEKESEADE